MVTSRLNPFNVTKAVDFTDKEIAAYFVDIDAPGFSSLADPQSPMPMLIQGGKGSGKTHLMRYFSYPLQRLRYRVSTLAGIQNEGYLGIYLRCGGLNSGRFKDKGQSDEVWATAFAYYMELWLSQLTLSCVIDYMALAGEEAMMRGPLVSNCIGLLDDATDLPEAGTLAEFATMLQRLQRELDVAINNCALTRSLPIRVRATSGRLVFGLPQLLAGSVPCLEKIRFLYLLDEYENLAEDQQRYVNTLLREKELPCSFKIGGRMYGFKTFKTYSDQEEIKEGSEYEILPLDSRLRDHKQYRQFATRLCARRLIQAGFAASSTVDPDDLGPMLHTAFELPPSSLLFESETQFIGEKYRNRERPYFAKLRERLQSGLAAGVTPGMTAQGDIDRVISLLECPDRPLIEKVNIFRLYQQWRSSDDLIREANGIGEQGRAFAAGERVDDYSALVEKRKHDLLAQLLRECGQKQRYLGFETFIDMSEGLPRNLLVILKNVFNWALFNGETPFSGGRISTVSQREGVREAAEWFFDDARMPGDDGGAIRSGVNRLATLFREVRFADKPSEKSVCTFSVDLSQCSLEAQRIIRLAEKWSLLIPVSGGQRDRNTMRVDEKFYVNAMLAPKWDLPVARGGALELSSAEVDSIFDPKAIGDYQRVLADRVARMTAPFFGAGRKRGNSQLSEQGALELGDPDA